MPINPRATLSGIRWNEVTWYSKLGAAIVLLGIVPVLCFYIGTLYQEVHTVPPIVAQEQTQYKRTSYYGGEIPTTWSEYGNGYIVAPLDDVSILQNEDEGYAHSVEESISPTAIVFSDIPIARLDGFTITPHARDVLVAKGKKYGTDSSKVLGDNTFEVIEFPHDSEGSITREYFYALPDSSDGVHEAGVFIEYAHPLDSDYDPNFQNDVEHYLATMIKLD